MFFSLMLQFTKKLIFLQFYLQQIFKLGCLFICKTVLKKCFLKRALKRQFLHFWVACVLFLEFICVTKKIFSLISPKHYCRMPKPFPKNNPFRTISLAHILLLLLSAHGQGAAHLPPLGPIHGPLILIFSPLLDRTAAPIGPAAAAHAASISSLHWPLGPRTLPMSSSSRRREPGVASLSVTVSCPCSSPMCLVKLLPPLIKPMRVWRSFAHGTN